MTILESVVQQGEILQSNVVDLSVLQSDVVDLVVLQSDVVYAIGRQGAAGSAKVATIMASAGVTATYTMLAAALLICVVAYGTGGGTITVEKQTSGGDIFTDEEYSADGNPVLSRPLYFLADEVLGITTTGAATIKIYYQ